MVYAISIVGVTPMKIDRPEIDICFCFDRDRTVDTGVPEGPVPIGAVRELEDSRHDVWATGNQALKGEAEIDGRDELLESVPGHMAVRMKGAGRRDMVWMVQKVSEADKYIVIDDVDLSELEGVTHYYPEDFVEEFDINDK